MHLLVLLCNTFATSLMKRDRFYKEIQKLVHSVAVNISPLATIERTVFHFPAKNVIKARGFTSTNQIASLAHPRVTTCSSPF